MLGQVSKTESKHLERKYPQLRNPMRKLSKKYLFQNVVFLYLGGNHLYQSLLSYCQGLGLTSQSLLYAPCVPPLPQ